MAGMNPSPVIGLGGTGQRAVLRLKQRLVADARYALLGAAAGVEVLGTGESDWMATEGVALSALDVAATDQPKVGDGIGLCRPRENPIVPVHNTPAVFRTSEQCLMTQQPPGSRMGSAPALSQKPPNS